MPAPSPVLRGAAFRVRLLLFAGCVRLGFGVSVCIRCTFFLGGGGDYLSRSACKGW